MRLLVRMLIGALVSLCIPLSVMASGDIAATRIEVTRLPGMQARVDVYYSIEWTADQEQFTYNVKLVQSRNGQVVALPIDEDQEVIPHPMNVCILGCPFGNGCTGTCHYKKKITDPWYEGQCTISNLVACENPNQSQFRCTCKSSSHSTGTLEYKTNDVATFLVEPGDGFADVDSTNNSISITVQ